MHFIFGFAASLGILWVLTATRWGRIVFIGLLLSALMFAAFSFHIGYGG